MEDKAGDQMVDFWAVALGVFAFLFLSNCLVLWVGWFRSVDVRGWWPLGLFFDVALAFAYAVAFSAAMRSAHRTGLGFTVIYNVILASLLFLHGYLFYTIKIDWLAVNSGTASLSAFQKFIKNDFTPIAIYAVFLLGAIVTGWMRRDRNKRERNQGM
ncbi:MAG: hypothetical protein NTY41_07160 [Proteobacteria bacterium]|nr:hypothetical protein [Pseudomonadota bacterium]